MGAEPRNTPPSGAVAAEFDSVCFMYPGQEALHDVTLKIPARSLVAVVGPNGGGKTTLLRLLLGELKPACGTVRVFGEDPRTARSRTGYVPQHTDVDPCFPLSVREAALMGRAGIAGLRYSAHDKLRAAEALERVHMADQADRPFAALSGGERQRVMIAQALAADPELLLLDEPVANVDPENSALLYSLFKELSSSVSILMVSHNLSAVTDRADWVVCVNRTAGIHKLGEIASETFRNSFGQSFALLRHDHCPVGGDCHAPGCIHFAHSGKAVAQ